MQFTTFSRRMQLVVPLAASLALGISTQATAANLGTASDYNVFTLGDFNQYRTDVEGKLAVGGNASFTGGFGVGSRLNPGSGNVLVAGGNLNINNGQVNNGNAVYGGTANVSQNVGFPNGTLSQGNPIDFAAAGNYLTGLSSYLGGLTTNGTTNIAYGGINLSGTDSTLNIFNLTAADLWNANSFNLNVANGSTVVVNVSGNAARMQYFGFNINGNPENAQRQKVLYNFYEATSLDLAGIGVQGSILATKAAVNFNNGNINGNLIANRVTGGGESHNYLFNGILPDMPSGSTGGGTNTGSTGGGTNTGSTGGGTNTGSTGGGTNTGSTGGGTNTGSTGGGTDTVQEVPEPSTLLGLGLISSLVGVLRRKQKGM